MPNFITPNSLGGELREFNPNHFPGGSAKGGQFAPKSTTVGITSARPGKTNREVFQQMQTFEKGLKAIKTVSNVKVQPGVGAWQGGREATWVVSYHGNGAATKLLAKTGKQYDQDAVLVLKGGAGGKGASPLVEYRFKTPVSSSQMDGVGSILAGHGLGGWTWFKSGGQTVLRAVAVPQWGGNSKAHLEAAKEVSVVLKAQGLAHTASAHRVSVSVMERSGQHSYDGVLKGV